MGSSFCTEGAAYSHYLPSTGNIPPNGEALNGFVYIYSFRIQYELNLHLHKITVFYTTGDRPTIVNMEYLSGNTYGAGFFPLAIKVPFKVLRVFSEHLIKRILMDKGISWILSKHSLHCVH